MSSWVDCKFLPVISSFKYVSIDYNILVSKIKNLVHLYIDGTIKIKLNLISANLLYFLMIILIKIVTMN